MIHTFTVIIRPRFDKHSTGKALTAAAAAASVNYEMNSVCCLFGLSILAWLFGWFWESNAEFVLLYCCFLLYLKLAFILHLC